MQRVTAFGTIERLAAGTVLFERDDRGVDFFLVLDGPERITLHRHTEITARR